MSAPEPTEFESKRPLWPGYLLGAYAVVAGLATLIVWSPSPAGWAAATRPLLGLAGLAGGLLLWCGDPTWRPLLRLWTLAQAVVLAVDASGELTKQPFLWLSLANVSTTAVNEQVTQMRSYGINVVGLVLFAVAHWIMARKWYLDTPVHAWQFAVLRVVRSLFVVIVLAVGGYIGWRWAPLVIEKNPLLVIHCPLPGAEVYAKDQRLGSTPLVITEKKLVEWGLSKPGGPSRCQVRRTTLEHGLQLTGNKSTAVLLLKAPRWCEKPFATFASEWGPRAVLFYDRLTSNRCDVVLLAKNQPGLVLSLPEGIPGTVAPGQPLEFSAVLRRHPLDSRLKIPLPTKPGQNAKLVVSFSAGTGVPTREVALPEAWRDPPLGTELRHVVKVAAPDRPGKYDVRVQYWLAGGPSGQPRLDAGTARSFGFVEVK